MKKNPSFWKTTQGNSVKYGVFLLLPYILFLTGLVFFSLYFFQTIVYDSAYYQLIVNENSDIETNPDSASGSHDDGFLNIPYQSSWAALNVEGWTKNTDIPVYFGNSDAILKRGAATPSYTAFCGQGGKIIISAHVTRHFSELEDTPVGNLVTLKTEYGGTYLYRIEKRVIFQQEDAAAYLSPADDEETLVLYTCYPRQNHYKPRTERCALICSKVSGKAR